MSTTAFILHQYGSLGILGLLSLGIIGLPIPDETLLLISGTLVKAGQLSFLPAWLACMLGPIIGISVSYLLGYTLGHFTIEKICQKFKLSTAHLHTAQLHFNQYGAWLLLIGYFIPGVRHFFGILAGTTQLSYRRFALFAYIGAILWGNLFFWLGFIFGNQAFQSLLQLYEHYGMIIISLSIILILFVIFILKKFVILPKL